MRSIGLVVVAAIVGCTPPHVTLRVPTDPTPEQRVAAFQELFAQTEKTTWTTTCHSACSTDIRKELRLANGTTVHYPEDLLPVVSANSVTAREVRRALSAQRRARYAAIPAVVPVVGFAAAGMYWFRNAGERDSPDPTTGEALAVGAFALGAIVSGFVIYHYRGAYAYHFGEANHAYNTDLAERLNVCVSGLGLVPCERVTSSAPGAAAHGVREQPDRAEEDRRHDKRPRRDAALLRVRQHPADAERARDHEIEQHLQRPWLARGERQEAGVAVAGDDPDRVGAEGGEDEGSER
jgi:hypothetical protein